MRWMFVIGNNNISENVLKEMKVYKDLYILDCKDDYNSLSLKVLTIIIKIHLITHLLLLDFESIWESNRVIQF